MRDESQDPDFLESESYPYMLVTYYSIFLLQLKKFLPGDTPGKRAEDLPV